MPSNLGVIENGPAKNTSMISILECSRCGKIISSSRIHPFCPDRPFSLLAPQDYVTIHNQINRDAILNRLEAFGVGTQSSFSWNTLSEGGTHISIDRIFIKCPNLIQSNFSSLV